jgi:hypothetical protein
MQQIYYSPFCTKIRDPAVSGAPDDVICMHRRSVQSCAARGTTKPTHFEAITSRVR